MSQDGYITISRRLFDGPLWSERREFSRAEAWIDLIQLARYGREPDDVLLGSKVYQVERGQLIKSARTLATRWGWSKSKVCRVLELFEKWDQIRRERDGKVARITICNYDRYQKPWDDGRTIMGRSWDDGGTMVGQEEYKEHKEDSETREEPRATPKVELSEPANGITPEARRLGALFDCCFEACRNRRMAGIQQPYADLLCHKALNIGMDPVLIEDAMAWLPEHHNAPFVPKIGNPQELGPEWFEKVNDARERLANGKPTGSNGKAATTDKDYSA